MLYRVAYTNAPPSNFPQQIATEILSARESQAIKVSSSAFSPNDAIPVEYTDYGKGISPPLSWSAPPAGTRAFVLMMEDPDATSPLPFVHWIGVAPKEVTQIPAGIPPIERTDRSAVARQGSNSRSTIGYSGPRPPAGDKPHAYHFQIFAVDNVPELPSGFNRHALLKSIEGHVLAKGEIVGTFAKAP
jgi:Raf kinase inhibitor-like YbhB/YbcL family protein